MIKFFKKIRQKLLTENRFSKYLLYAVGEIILVVVGILIALSINNWNESKKKHVLETKILNEILSNLDSDLKNLDVKIAENNKYILSNTKVLEHLNYDLPITDSLRSHYSILFGHGNFQPNTIGYDNLKSMGIDIVRNDQLKKEISELYSFKYYRFVEDRRNVVRTFQDLQRVILSENIKVIKSREKAEPINLDELRHNIQFKSILLENITLLENLVNQRYNQGKEDIELVAKSIRDELKNN